MKLNEHSYLPILSERMNIDKIVKLVSNLYDKNEYAIHIINLKQALNHGLISKQVHRVFEFNQTYRLNPYIDMNTELRQKAKNNLRKHFSS